MAPNDNNSESSSDPDPDPDPDSSSSSRSRGSTNDAEEGNETNANTAVERTGGGGAHGDERTASSSGNDEEGSVEPGAPFVYPTAPEGEGDAPTNNADNFEDEDPLIQKKEDDAEGEDAPAPFNPLNDDPMVKPLIIFLVVCTLLAVIIFPILFKVVLPNSKNKSNDKHKNNNQNDQPKPATPIPAPVTMAPVTPAPTPLEWVMDLPESWKTKILTDPTSSTALAYQWVAEDPNLSQYPMEQRKQRFALAGLFHATGGANWARNGQWLAYLGGQSECSWEGVICGGSDTATMRPVTSDPVTIGTEPPAINSTILPTTLAPGSNATFVPTDVAPVSNITTTFPATIAPTGIETNTSNIFNQVSTRFLRRNLQVNATATATATDANATSATNSFDRVQFLDLTSNNLNGFIPEEISLLTDLQILNLKDNSLIGPMPLTIFDSLVNLLEFNVHNNNLGGMLPGTVGKWANLGLLDLSSNQLSGSLPSELGLLALLQSFIVRDNRFNATLPSDFSTLGALQYLDMGQNLFSGPIPTTWMSLSGLSNLILDSNNLTGIVPPEVGPPNIDLKELNIANNPLLAGVIPSRFCYLDILNFTCHPDENLHQLCGCGSLCSCGNEVSPLIPPGGDLSTFQPAQTSAPASNETIPLPATNGTASPSSQQTFITAVNETAGVPIVRLR